RLARVNRRHFLRGWLAVCGARVLAPFHSHVARVLESLAPKQECARRNRDSLDRTIRRGRGDDRFPERTIFHSGAACYGYTPWIVLTYARNECQHAQHIALSIQGRAQTRSPLNTEAAERSRRLRSRQPESQAQELKPSDTISQAFRDPGNSGY